MPDRKAESSSEAETGPAPDTSAAGSTPAPRQPGTTQKKIAELAAHWASSQWPDRLMIAVSLLLIAAAFAGLAWVCWFWWTPVVWEWGFATFGWRSVLALLAILYLAMIPFSAVMLFPAIIGFWNEYGALRRQVTSARETQDQIEHDLLTNDPYGLVPILSYSRAMLSEYYAIAMSQAQRSFRYCLIAMWLGFVILVAGVLDSFVPLTGFLAPQPGEGAAGRQMGDTNDLVLITGVVIEFIAAAFLWVYRFTIQQQTYYYRRQFRLHNALLAHRLTAGMGQAKDDAIKLIVERLLEDTESPAAAEPDRRGIAALLKR